MALRTLLLTSPMMRGDDVVALQNLIKGSDPKMNPTTFIDGVFGERTRDALKRFQQANAFGGFSNGIATPAFQAQYQLDKATAVFLMPGAAAGRPTVIGPPLPPSAVTVIGPPLPGEQGGGPSTKAGFLGGAVSFFRENPIVAGALALGVVTIGALLFLPGKESEMGDVVSRRRARIIRAAGRARILVRTFPDSGGYRWEVTRGDDLVGSGWEPSKSGAARVGGALKKRELPRAA